VKKAAGSKPSAGIDNDFCESCIDEEPSCHTGAPRINVEKTLQAVTWLLNNHPDEFGDEARARRIWKDWATNHPSTVESVAEQEKPSWEWPPAHTDYSKCLPPDLAKRTVTFAETIEYQNAINQKACGPVGLGVNLAIEKGIEDVGYQLTRLTKGQFLWIRNKTVENERRAGWRSPILLARLYEDDSKDVEPRSDDTLSVEWWGAFSYNTLRDELNHVFEPVCALSDTLKSKGGAIIRYHAWRNGDDTKRPAWTAGKRSTCCQGAHKVHPGHGPMTGKVERSSVLLATSSQRTFTDKGHIVSAKGKDDVRSQIAGVMHYAGMSLPNYFNDVSKPVKHQPATTNTRLWETAAQNIQALISKETETQQNAQ